jgi:hypothetical protein
MLRPRPALAALATVLAVAVGSTAAVLTTHRPSTATGGTVVTTQLPDTTAPPPSTTSPSTGPQTHRPTQPTTPQPPTTSPRISDPAQAARQLFQAWQAGDQPRARQAATPSTVRTLFAFTPTPKLGFAGCRFSSHGYDCFYTSTDVGLWYLDMRVEGGASAGYRVVSINAQMRFGSPDAAAKYVVKAWLDNDRVKARRAASETVLDALWSRSGDRAHRPRFDGCTFRGINRGSDCAFGYTTVGLGFTLQVKGGASLGWQAVAIQFAQL